MSLIDEIKGEKRGYFRLKRAVELPKKMLDDLEYVLEESELTFDDILEYSLKKINIARVRKEVEKKTKEGRQPKGNDEKEVSETEGKTMKMDTEKTVTSEPVNQSKTF